MFEQYLTSFKPRCRVLRLLNPASIRSQDELAHPDIWYASRLIRVGGKANSTSDGVSVYTVLEKGLEDLMAMCDVVEKKYTIARDEFVNKMEE